jgi:sortase B
MRNRRVALGVLAVFAFVGLLLTFLNAAREIVPQMAEYRAAAREYQEIRAIARAPMTEANEGDAGEPQSIDWAALHLLNPEIIAWIVIDGTTIDYPITQGADNDWYLHHTASGERNPSGAIFMDFRNASDFSDGHTLIYGHNMQDGSMFAPLHGWAGDHFVIHTPDGRRLEYLVFARYTVAANDPLFAFASDLGDGVQVVTLSTCVFRREDLRYVVHGKLVEGGN